jgi:FKBP-type peptidyl-prolyl cis-trans isomerase
MWSTRDIVHATFDLEHTPEVCPPLMLARTRLLSFAAAFGLVACSTLTEPPQPVSFAAGSAAPTPSASAAARPSATASAAPPPSAPAAPPPGDQKVQIATLKPGKGAGAQNGDKVSVHYTGTLLDGSKFDSSRDRNKPFDLTLGSGQVIKGWEQGLPGMKVGETRKLVIPPGLAYGASARPGIPANSTLVFEIEMLSINGK